MVLWRREECFYMHNINIKIPSSEQSNSTSTFHLQPIEKGNVNNWYKAVILVVGSSCLEECSFI